MVLKVVLSWGQGNDDRDVGVCLWVHVGVFQVPWLGCYSRCFMRNQPGRSGALIRGERGFLLVSQH